jgi:hypothetical protein
VAVAEGDAVESQPDVADAIDDGDGIRLDGTAGAPHAAATSKVKHRLMSRRVTDFEPISQRPQQRQTPRRTCVHLLVC